MYNTTFQYFQHILIGSHVRGLACITQRQAEPTHAYNAVLAEFAMQVEQDALIISAEGFMDIDYSLLMSVGLLTVLIISSISDVNIYIFRYSQPWLLI